jgi:SanA protein
MTFRPLYLYIALRLLLYALAAVAICLIACNSIVSFTARQHLYDNADAVPHNRVGLILGTSRYLSPNQVNLYFVYRIEAAVALYRQGKIDYLLVSGDNSSIYYNEPREMQKALIEAGIPSERIYLDYAGFRTLDSVVRSKLIFNQSEITIISQKFHNERALYIARNRGLSAVAFNAQDVSVSTGIKTQVRELFARVKVMLDIHVLSTQPKFGGQKIGIGLENNSAQ